MALERLGVEMVVQGLGTYKGQLQQAQAATDKAAGATSGLARAQERGVVVGARFVAGLLGVTLGVQALRLGFDAVIGGALEWESALAGVAKTVDASDAEIAALGDSLTDMSERIPVGRRELAGLAEVAGQLGVRTENIEDFVEVAAKLGTTTNLAAEQAIVGLSRFMNVMGTSEDQIGNLGSALVALGNKSEATESEILEMAQRLASAGRTVGLTEGEVLGLATALSSLGIEAEAGGSAFSRLMGEMATRAALGGKELEGMAKAAGMTAAAFSRMVKESPANALGAFIKGLRDAQARGENLFVVLNDLGLNEVRLRNAILSTAGGYDTYVDSMTLAAESSTNMNALNAEAARRFETTASKIEIAKNQLGNMASDLGEQALPAISAFLEGVSSLGDTFDALGTSIAGSDKATIDQLPHIRDLIAAQEELVANSNDLSLGFNELTLARLKDTEATLLAREEWVRAATTVRDATLAASDWEDDIRVKMIPTTVAATTEVAALGAATGSSEMAIRRAALAASDWEDDIYIGLIPATQAMVKEQDALTGAVSGTSVGFGNIASSAEGAARRIKAAAVDAAAAARAMRQAMAIPDSPIADIGTSGGGFAAGGRVPGPLGSPVSAVVHAGEVVLNRAQQSGVLHAAAGLASMVARLASPGTRMSAPASPVSSTRLVPVPVTLREGPSVHVNASYQQVQSPTSISQDVSFILMRAGL